MPDISRNFRPEDYMAVTRALDRNRNNRLDPQELSFTYGASSRTGNGNGIQGTRETANALKRGDIYVSRVSDPYAANDIAAYFSARSQNYGRPRDQWVADDYISKDDLYLDAYTRQALDTNYDGRISRRELAYGLEAGAVTIGTPYGHVGPTPPPVGRPTPPPTGRPTPPPVYPY